MTDVRLLAALLVFALLPFSTCVPYGAGCEYTDGRSYHLAWAQSGNNLNFQLTLWGLVPGVSGWSGVGFGESMHSGLDVIVVRLYNGQVQVTDEYVQGFRSPSPDAVQNVATQGVSNANGVIRVQFTRPIYSTDPYDRPLAGCTTWKFPVGLHRMSPQGGLHHHSGTPHSRTICLQGCQLNSFYYYYQSR